MAKGREGLKVMEEEKRTSDSSGEDSVIGVLGGEVGSSLGGKVL